VPAALPDQVSFARRLLALAVDWGACILVLMAFLGPAGWANSQWATLLLFVGESAVLTALAGGSFGKLATRLRVLREDGRPLDLVRSLLRAVLVALVIPPLVFRPDGRGLHDMAVGSRTVRLLDLRAA